MKIRSIQSDFSGGELSPRSYGRTDTKRYHTGFKDAYNFVVNPQGSISKRAPFQHVDDSLASQDEKVRLLPIPMADRPDMMMEITPSTIRIRDEDSPFRLPDTSYVLNLITNTDFDKGIDGLTGWEKSIEVYNHTTGDTSNTQSVENINFANETPKVQNGTLHMVSVWTYRTNRSGGSTVSIDPLIRVTNGVTKVIPIPAGSSSNNLTLSVNVGPRSVLEGIGAISPKKPFYDWQGTLHPDGTPYKTLFVGQLGYTTIDGLLGNYFIGGGASLGGVVKIGTTKGSGNILTQDLTTGNNEFTVNAGGASTLYMTIEPKQFGPNDIYIVRPNDANDYTRIASSYYLNVENISLIDPAVTGGGGLAEFDNPFSNIDRIKIASDTSSNAVYIVDGSAEPHIFETNDSATSFTLNAMSVVNKPWSTDKPSAVEVYQGRLWLFRGSSIWGSKSGNHSDFTLGSNSDDAISRELAMDGRIYWAKGSAGVMFLGTDRGILAILSEGQLLTTQDMGVDLYSSYAAADIDSIRIGSRVVYVSRDRKRIRSLQYVNDRKAWTSIDLMKYSDHLGSVGVSRLISLPEPDSQIVALLDDSTWIQCTFDPDDPEMPINAWHRHFSDAGSLMSVAAVNNGSGDTMFVVVSRINGKYLEKMDMSFNPYTLLDGRVKRFATDNGDGTFTVPDMKKFKGSNNLFCVQDNAIIFTDSESTNITFDANDNMTFTSDMNEILPDSSLYFGHNYVSRLTTMPVETLNVKDTISAAMKRSHKVHVMIVDSAFPAVNGQIPADRDPVTPMDTAEPLRTEMVEYANLGHSRFEGITITQELPIRTEIVSISLVTNVERDD